MDGQDERIRVTLGTWDPGEGLAPAVGADVPGKFEVVAMRAGKANGLLFDEGVLFGSVNAGLWDGATMFVDHAGALDWNRSVNDVAGVFSGAKFDAKAGTVWGVMHCAGPKGRFVQELARTLVEDRGAGRPAPNIGLSADLFIRRNDGDQVGAIVAVNSLDVVFNPAAGGAFVRALNAVRDLTQRRQDAKENGEGQMSEDTVVYDVPAVVTGGDGVPSTPEGRQEAALGSGAPGAPGARLERALNSLDVAMLQCEHAVNLALRDAALPAPLADVARERLSGRLVSVGEIAGEIERQKGVWSKLVESDVVKGLGRQRASVQVGMDGMSRIKLAFDRLLGLPAPAGGWGDVPRLSGIRELYHQLTGDFEFRGVVDAERAMFANATTTTMAGVVTDGFNKLLIQQFAKREAWWEPISVARDLQYWQTMKMTRPFGFAALDTVAEGGPYTEQTWDDQPETASIVKKGNYIGLTIEMIMADDLNAVQLIPKLLGTAAWNALSDTVSAVFTANSGAGPTMADTGALFNATAIATAGGHLNLLTTALTQAQFETVAIAMMKKTEQGSGRKLGLMPKWLLVPADLWSMAVQIREAQTMLATTGKFDPSPWYHTFEVIMVPPWTDTSDWAVCCDINLCEGIVIGYPFGRRQPELFVADDGTTGSMFTNDEMRIKARFAFAVGVADWHGLANNHV